MSRALVTLLTVGALLAGGGVAFAAWTSSGPGTVTARAGALAAPAATAAAWTCGSTPATPRFASGGRAVEDFRAAEAFPAAAPTTTAPAAPLAATTTTTTTTTAAPTTTSAAPPSTTVTPTTSGPAAAAATTTTTTTVPPPTTSTSGVVTGLGAAATTLRWGAVPTAVGYQFQADNTADFSSPVAAGTTGATSATVTVRAILPTTIYLRVRGVLGGWNGPWSSTVTTTAGPCLL